MDLEGIRAVQEMLPEEGCAIVFSEVTRRWLTGFESSDGVLFITKGEAVLLLDFRYIEAGGREAKGCRVELLERASKQLAAMTQQAGVKTALVEADTLTLTRAAQLAKDMPGVSLDTGRALSLLLGRLRMTKTPEELDSIRRAQKITDEAFAQILTVLRPGMTELDVAAELEYAMKKRGSQRPAFETIAVAGPNSSRPHGVPGARPIQNGDLLTMDFGAVWNGYCSDMTRTIAIGSIGDDQRRV